MILLGVLELSKENAYSSIYIERDKENNLFIRFNDTPIFAGEINSKLPHTIFHDISKEIKYTNGKFFIPEIGKVTARYDSNYAPEFSKDNYKLYPEIELKHGGFKNLLRLFHKLNIKYYRRGDCRVWN